MPVTVAPQFGSFVYDSSSVSVENWDDDLDVGTVVVPVPRSDRARDADGYLRPRRIDVRGIIGQETGTSREDLRTALDAFTWAHRPGRRNLYRDADRYLKNAQVESVRLQDEGLLWVRYDLRFIAADPFWYAATPDADTWSTPADTDTRSLNNQGAATALPVFTIEMSSTGTLELELTNNTTGKVFTVSGLAAEDGDELVIDGDAQTVTLNGVNKMSSFEGEFFALDPGSNTLELSLAGVTLATIQTAWVKRWL